MNDKEIELEAYYLWEKAGKPDSLSDYFWNLAKERIESMKQNDCVIWYSNIPYKKQIAIWKMNANPREELTRILLDEIHQGY